MKRGQTDIEKLRKELIDLLGTAMFTVSGVASIDLDKVYRASPEELIEIAEEYGIKVDDMER